MKQRNPFDLLKRKDKWYLGGGNRLQWAPEFPLFLDFPGFWDPGSYYNISLKPLFTWALLDEKGNELALKFVDRKWTPAVLEQRFISVHQGTTIEISESRSILPNDVALSRIRIVRKKGKPSRRLNLIAWTALETHPGGSHWVGDPKVYGSGISFIRHVRQAGRPDQPVASALGISGKVRSHSVILSEAGAILPQWSLSPFSGQFQGGSLPDKIETSGVSDGGFLFIALHIPVSGSGKTKELSVGLSLAPTHSEAVQNLGLVLKQKDPAKLSTLSWDDYASTVPAFECSDPFLETSYWYRWYGLRLNTMYGGEGNYRCPFVCEGIGYFRAPISYSAPCHVLENRWLHEPDLARGSLQVFFDNQRENGAFRGYIDVKHDRKEMFYHANWGNALAQLDRVHPSRQFLGTAYSALERYVRYLDRERDSEGSGLYDINNHYETGQEYMSRYLAVNDQADRDHWGNIFRLKGVDVTVYVYELKRSLRWAAEKLDKETEAARWEAGAQKIKQAVLALMWDPREEMFFDVNPATGKRTGSKAATNFYPYATDIPDKSHLEGMKRHLFNPKEFWTKFPVPSSSVDDTFFSPEPVWKGKRMNCPWNGRVWPMTNSHIAEAIALSAIRFDDSALRKTAAGFIMKFIRMMFFDGDSSRPNCFEHYNPLTGQPCQYRGIDDYQHSWVNDLIVKYVCGIRPDDLTVTIDPFPFGLKSASIRNVFVRGRMLDVEIRGKSVDVRIDGAHHAESRLGMPIVLQI